MSNDVKIEIDAEKKALDADWQVLEDERLKLVKVARTNQTRQNQIRDEQLQLRGAFQRLEDLALKEKKPKVEVVEPEKKTKDGKK